MTPITVNDLHEATAQEVFDTIVQHVQNQGRPSFEIRTHHDGVKSHQCRYRNKDGLACAAGCLIPDEDYSPGMEGALWAELVDSREYSPNHQYLIRRLQSGHDASSHYDDFLPRFREQARDIASQFDLDPSEVTP